MQINKVTTKIGDKGLTLGPGCKMISKNSQDIEFLGNLDELNAFIGELTLYIEKNQKDLINKIQNDLFDIGASFYKKTDVDKIYYETLDNIIEQYQKNPSKLTSFLLPQGSKKTIQLHIIRAITRRTERSFFKTLNNENTPNIAIYLNRLSDVFFIFLRENNEILWEKSN